MAAKSVSRDLETKAGGLVGRKGHTANLVDQTDEFVSAPTTSCAPLKRASGWPSVTLQARPIYHHECESIDPYLTIVFAALAASDQIEAKADWGSRPTNPHRSRLANRRPSRRHRRPCAPNCPKPAHFVTERVV